MVKNSHSIQPNPYKWVSKITAAELDDLPVDGEDEVAANDQESSDQKAAAIDAGNVPT